MANFLKIVSGVYLLLVWVGFVATVVLAPAPDVYSGPLALLIALGASIPAVSCSHSLRSSKTYGACATTCACRAIT